MDIFQHWKEIVSGERLKAIIALLFLMALLFRSFLFIFLVYISNRTTNMQFYKIYTFSSKFNNFLSMFCPL
jgi:hypothetical protein